MERSFAEHGVEGPGDGRLVDSRLVDGELGPLGLALEPGHARLSDPGSPLNPSLLCFWLDMSSVTTTLSQVVLQGVLLTWTFSLILI